MRDRVFLVLVGVALAGCAPIPPAGEGLMGRPSRHLDDLQLRAGGVLAGYRKVLIDPARVELNARYVNAYSRSAPRGIDTSSARRSASETALSLESSVTEAFRTHGYEIVAAPGPGVLRLSPSATDLYINAPEALSPWPTMTFTREAGEAKLLLEARDAVSGVLVGRVAHKGIAREVGKLTLADDVANRFWFDALFRRWAENCAEELAAARDRSL